MNSESMETTSAQANPNQLRTLFEGARRLGISYWKLYRAGEAGLVKTVRLGGRVMIPEGELAHVEQTGFGPGKQPRKKSRRSKKLELGEVQ